MGKMRTTMNELVFLKLGGSLITDKDVAHSARIDVIQRIASEISQTMHDRPGMKLLLGHGSGSFAHIAAHRYNTRDGVRSPEDWHGFAEVWHEAKALNTIVTDALVKANLPAVVFSPCSQILTRAHRIQTWDTRSIKIALDNGLMPLVYGDVVFDTEIGGTILSTEEQFEYLASKLRPVRILIAGIEAGVWKNYPERTEVISKITPSNFKSDEKYLSSSQSTDVTGGMRSKVLSMMNLIETGYCDEVCIFSGLESGSIHDAITGNCAGTRICHE
jgi:isopentenyl phosphate kinase